MKKIIVIIIMISLMLPTIIAGTTKIYPNQDAFVRDSSSTTNYGDLPNLRAGYNGNFGVDRSYLKFDVSSLQGKNIQSATFSIYTLFHQNSPKINLYSASTSWNENTINWNNKPSQGELITSKTISSNNRMSFTIPVDKLSGNSFSFVLIEDGENTDAQFYSKDLETGNQGDETFWPYIEVTHSGTSPDPTYHVADTNQDGTISLTEYNDFKYGYKNGLVSGVSLTEYNDIKYAFKNGLL
jgi:hypothetical protein